MPSPTRRGSLPGDFGSPGLFDVHPDLVGTIVRGVVVRHVNEMKQSTAGDPPSIGVITAPAAVAQDVADRLVDAGAGSILNFAPRVLRVPPSVLLRYVDLSMELQVMSFFLSHRETRCGFGRRVRAPSGGRRDERGARLRPSGRVSRQA